ncbi:hypothetical protein A1QS_11820 [Vibrio ordalii FS-238]|uniref:Uncharacterized protein n=2 Tax=Vibrio ordalii TaxID=28174 RepID=A0A853R0Q5_9VIBR|nr:hypothetical protein A1QS_11820 [Vibrio ordalii FS-238]
MNQEELNLINDIVTKLQPSKTHEWIPVIAALLGASIGAIASLIPSRYLEVRRERQFSVQVKRSLIAEISALVRVVESRNYVAGVEEAITFLKANPGRKYTFYADIPPHYSQIYQEHCKHLGVLEPEVARDVIHFYQLIDAVVQDVKVGGAFTTHPSLQGYEESLQMFKLAVKIGKKLESGSYT